ncbi:hypothetical protein [Actinoplanes sp. DH11]|uniref:hypothetical protein n=1 Tax=Actinoplanes sp. DH11 TaxID=2857011 RepID=UPI001E636AAD|nr:hypothetical protein [Actinoplanes sp. DH11]
MNPLRWPLWLRCQITGFLWSGLMYGLGGDRPHTWFGVGPYLVMGVVFGLALWGVTRVHVRRLFGDLSGAERETVIEAVRTARPPADPRLGDAATRVARHWARPRLRPVPHALFFGFFVVLSIWLGFAVTPWAWLGVVLWPLAAWYSWRGEQREQRTGERFLDAVS